MDRLVTPPPAPQPDGARATAPEDIIRHLTEAEKLIGLGFQETGGTWALVYQQAATVHATIALTLVTARTTEGLTTDLNTARAMAEDRTDQHWQYNSTDLTP